MCRVYYEGVYYIMCTTDLVMFTRKEKQKIEAEQTQPSQAGG